MTMIVKPQDYPSKKGLKEALDAGCLVHEPSMMGEWTRTADLLPVGFKGVVTNHPLRTKFAEIERTPGGWKVS